MRARAKRLVSRLLGRAGPAAAVLRVLGAMAAAPAASGLPRLARRVELALTKRLALFDRAYYLEQCTGPRPAVALRDYVLHGEATGRRPAPLVDPQHYRSQIDVRVPGRALNTLLHYGLWGRFRGISPSPWFDVGYYLRSNGDVAAAGIDPLRHFSRYGWREGRNPLPGLDMRVVLRDHPGLRVSKSNPLVHLLQELGRTQTRLPDASARADDEARNAPLLDVAAWEGRRARGSGAAPRVDVIVPVYSGTGETLRCLWSVLDAPVATPFELVVIDDAGPDPVLSEMLDALADRGLLTLRRNAVNLGFVATVNAGLRLHPERDVVILNADTEVHNDWLDRLLAVAATEPRIASVTPLSNNATICSYPETLHDNWLRLEVDDAELDRLAARANGLDWVAAPTGVGFCMFMRRACIDAIGAFDEKHFGRGYGEENDWCQRALTGGWINALAAGVFVRHHGGTSFGGEKAERCAAAMRTLARLRPTYDAQVQAHIAADPLWRARARIDLARLARHRRERNALLVCHDRGGGTERHLMEQAGALQARGWGVFEMRPSKKAGAIALNHPRLLGQHAAGAIVLERDDDFFVDALRELGITSIELHHAVDFPDEMPDLLFEARDALRIELNATVHDYRAICPRINLARPDGRYCGEPDAAGCNACLAADGLRAKSGDIAAWRKRHVAVLTHADRVRVPDEDVAARLGRYVPGLAMQVVPHDDSAPSSLRRPAGGRGDRPARVLVLGAIGLIKGYDVLLRLATIARQERLPVEFSLLGFSMDDTRLVNAGVHLLGRYDDSELAARVDAADPDLVFLPSIWPETYCYTLSAALRSGRPIAVFDIGAQARRLRANARPPSRVLPLALADDPRGLIGRLLAIAGDDATTSQRPAVRDPRSDSRRTKTSH